MGAEGLQDDYRESASTAQVAKGKRRRRSLEDWAYETLGSRWGGNTCPPMDNRAYRWQDTGMVERDDYWTFSQGEDGGTMWIGHANEWKFHLSLKRFRRIALWTIWQWAWGDWFGLRTWLWYRILRRKVNRYKGALRNG